MKHVTQVIITPLITEKSTGLKDTSRILCFRVAKKANKVEIKDAVEELFNVRVTKVRTLAVHGKWKRLGRNPGRTPDWKKAYVTLAEGEKMIEYFEGT